MSAERRGVDLSRASDGLLSAGTVRMAGVAMDAPPQCATVLIIDDCLEDREAYKAFLRQQPHFIYTFLEAEDADDGIRIHNQAQVDVILLDYELPDLDGLNFLERLHQENGQDVPPVVMVTGRGNERVAVQALKEGATDYLVKSSVTPETLARTIRSALQTAALQVRLERETKERQVAVEELRESEMRFRLLVESVRDYAIVMLDKDGHITSWNAGARAVFGYHDKEILGQHVRRLFTPEDVRAKQPEREMMEADMKERAFDERCYVRKGGERFWATAAVFPVRNAQRYHCGYSKVVHDTTATRQTLMRLEDALAARDDFLAVAGNELKTPVAELLREAQKLRHEVSASQKVGQQPAAEALQGNLETLSGGLGKLAEQVNNLFDVLRLMAGDMALNPEPIELGELVRNVVEHSNGRDQPAEHWVSLNIAQAPVGLWDRRRLEQVLVNVLDNAHKYAPGKPIRVQVGRNGNTAVVAITDEGPGVLLEDQERIFERFERGGSAHKVPGLGLGLYVSRHLLQSFGGSLFLSSEPGCGATFTIELPIGETSESGPAR